MRAVFIERLLHHFRKPPDVYEGDPKIRQEEARDNRSVYMGNLLGKILFNIYMSPSAMT